MKFVMAWTPKASTTEMDLERSLKIFSKWSPAPSVTFHHFLGRIDAGGGFAVVETDDVSQMNKDVSIFAAFLDFQIYPVDDIQVTSGNAMEASAFRASIE